MHNPFTSSQVAILKARWKRAGRMSALAGDGGTRRHRGWVALTLAVSLTSCADQVPDVLAPTRSAPPAPFEITATTQSAGATILASDSFSRTLTGGWGTADIGGNWNIGSSDAAIFEVNGAQGLIHVPNSGPRVARLSTVAGVNASGIVSFVISEAPDNLSRFHTIELYARRSSSGDKYYRYRVRAFGNGKMDIRAENKVNGVNTWLSDNTPLSTIFQPGVKYWVRWECIGSSPSTAVRMRVWPDGSGEPSGWQITTTADAPALDAAGFTAIGVAAPSTDQITFPVTFAFDDLQYVSPEPNDVPVAVAGGPYSAVVVTPIQLDGSGSSDADGDLPLRYDWDFGDGTTGTGATPTHTYAATGVYTAKLTVTDARGLASAPGLATVTVNPESPNDLLKDRFSRVETAGWGRPEVGGFWFTGGVSNATAFEVKGGQGLIVLRNTTPRNVVGTEGYGVNVAGLASFSIDAMPDDPTRFHQVQTYARRNDRIGASDGDNYYRYRVRAFGDGRMDLRIEKNVAATLTWLTGSTPIPIVWEPGAKYWIRWECVGTSPSTVISMKVWRDGTVEPPWPQVSATVDEPLLDVSGTTGFRVSAPSGQITFPITFTFDDLAYVIKN